MNILPKKRWHVRTKENIARVRKDEAIAAEQAKVEEARIKKAESEARLKLLRNESRSSKGQFCEVTKEQSTSVQQTSKHINFFEELEQGNIDYKKTNKEFEKDKKEEQEKYEKQIGLLTYLGQGVKEAADSSWYNELPKRLNDTDKNIEIKPNKKAFEDPMNIMKRLSKIISMRNESTLDKKIDTIKKETDYKLEKLVKVDSKSEKWIGKGKKRKHESDSANDSSTDNHKSHKKHKKFKKHKKSKKHKRDKDKDSTKVSSNLEKLRMERLEREKRERLRAQALIAEAKEQESSQNTNTKPTFKQKYNSQFFPELARQNCEKPTQN